MNMRDAPVLSFISSVWPLEPWCVHGENSRFLQKFLCFSIISAFNLLFVDEVFFVGDVRVDFESVLVEGVVGFLAADVMDGDGVGFDRAVIAVLE